MDPNKYLQLVVLQRCKNISKEGPSLFNKWYWSNGYFSYQMHVEVKRKGKKRESREKKRKKKRELF